MSILSDNKLHFLESDYSNSVWYITKQNCNFRDLALMARILELWNDDPNESFQSFFDRTKNKEPFNAFISNNTPHRALKNCEFYGLMTPTAFGTKVAYSSQKPTDVYFLVKETFATPNSSLDFMASLYLSCSLLNRALSSTRRSSSTDISSRSICSFSSLAV